MSITEPDPEAADQQGLCQQGACHSQIRKIPEFSSRISALTRQKNPRGHICRAIGVNPVLGAPLPQTPNELLTILVQPPPVRCGGGG
jgi:hypothetical protein